MEGKKKNNVKKSSTKSKKTVKKTNLNSDELLEQILNKKKNDKVNCVNKSKNTGTVENLELTNKQNVEKKLKEVNKSLKDSSLDADKILELINEKKKLRKELSALKKAEEAKEKENAESKEKITIDETVDVNNIYKSGDLVKKRESKKSEEPKICEKEIVPKENLGTKETIVVEEKKIENRHSFKKFEFNREDLGIIFAILAFVLALVGGIFIFKSDTFSESTSEEVQELEVIDRQKELQDQQYNECLMRPVDDNDRTENIIELEKELTNYLSKYKTSVGYNDINTGFSFYYNQDQVYYAASSIKALAVLYLYKQADQGIVNLDTTMKYTSKYKAGASKEMEKVSLNTDIKLRDLAKYTITVSDNTAYAMLVSYLGKSNIQNFGKSLGAKYTLVGGDNFGNITVSDGLIYWNAINEFLNTNSENANEFYSYLLAADQNGLSITDYDIEAVHKYGEYSPFYNDLGIVYAENPYIVVILTKEFGSSMIATIQDINLHVYNLHLAYYANRENICKLEIYGS